MEAVAVPNDSHAGPVKVELFASAIPSVRTRPTCNTDTSLTIPPNTRTPITGNEESDRQLQSPSPVTSPPYWVQSHSRSFSNISVETIHDGAITLQDNTDGEDGGRNKACWAKSVLIEDYVVVNGNRTVIGAFVVWNITVDTLHVSLDIYSLTPLNYFSCARNWHTG